MSSWNIALGVNTLIVLLTILPSTEAAASACPRGPTYLSLPGGGGNKKPLFSSAVVVGNGDSNGDNDNGLATVYISGQLGLDPATKKLAEGGFEAEAKQSLANLLTVLELAGGSTSSLVKTTVLLTDIGNYDAMNVIYEAFFANSTVRPARAAYAVQALPLKALIEVEAVAVVERKC